MLKLAPMEPEKAPFTRAKKPEEHYLRLLRWPAFGWRGLDLGGHDDAMRDGKRYSKSHGRFGIQTGRGTAEALALALGDSISVS